MDEKQAHWHYWIGETLLTDLEDPESPDPVPLFASTEGSLEMSSEVDSYRWGKNNGEYLYLLYLLDEPVEDAGDVIPVYIGETTNISQRIREHAHQIRSSLPTDAWEDTGKWGSFSKYDHMALVHEQASGPLYVWILDVESLEAGPYGYSTHRHELEATLVGLVHAQPAFEGVFANREFVPNRIAHEIGKIGPEWVSLEREVTKTAGGEEADLWRESPTNLNITKADRWRQWIEENVLADIHSADTGDPIPLFDVDEAGCVKVNDAGILQRSAAIDRRIRAEGKKCLTDDGRPNGEYDGLLYLLYQIDESTSDPHPDDVISRYFGKAEIYGKKRELSSNFTEIARDSEITRCFARWGDGDYWHIGELSMTLRGESQKKARWANALFEKDSLHLKQPTYLWVRAWEADSNGPYGVPATLAEAEALLIGLAYNTHSDHLLNVGGTPTKRR